MHYLLSLFELHNESIKKQVGISKSATTYRKYETTRKHLQGYLRTKCLEDIILENINHAFICGFEVYLRVTAHCAHNYIGVYDTPEELSISEQLLYYSM